MALIGILFILLVISWLIWAMCFTVVNDLKRPAVHIVGMLSFFLVGCFLSSFGAISDYSTGTRTGVVQKLSHKGITWVTWEGEMVLGGLGKTGTSGTGPNLWQFTIPKEKEGLIALVENARATGARVSLTYRQYLIKPVWYGSPYLITNVTIEDEKE